MEKVKIISFLLVSSLILAACGGHAKTEYNVIYLDDEAASWAYYVLLQGAKYTAALIEAENEGTDGSHLINRLDSSVISFLDEHIFDDGYPKFWPFERDIYVKPEFTSWIINRAKEKGVFERRLKYSTSPRIMLTADLRDCSPGSDSLNFNVFGEIFTVPVKKANITEGKQH